MKTRNYSLFGLLAILAAIFTSIKVSGSQTIADLGVGTVDIDPELIQYQEAVLNAATAEESEILSSSRTIRYDPQLEGISWRMIKKDRYQVRVATFISSDTFNPQGSQEIWVTVVPDLREYCYKYKMNTGADKVRLTKRIVQLLGLPPKSPYQNIAEFWIDEKFLIRPTLNPNIKYSGKQTLPTKIDLQTFQSDHKDITNKYPIWFNRQIDQQLINRDKNFVSKLLINDNPGDDPYPWTGLGYTFDWGSDADPITHAGLSEFLILDSENLVVKDLKLEVTSTESYCKP